MRQTHEIRAMGLVLVLLTMVVPVSSSLSRAGGAPAAARPARPAGSPGPAFKPGAAASTPTAPGAPLSAACLPGWVGVPSPNLPSNQDHLTGIAAAASADLWVVGAGLGGPLVEHWDGATWITSTVPISGTGITLQAVAARSATDAWAVGAYYTGGQHGYTLTEHWNGSRWSSVPSPSGPVDNMLYSVVMSAADDVWAVGGGGTPLLLHWNGVAWSSLPAPGLSDGTRLYGVADRAANDVWAVGDEAILHWNGTTWSTAVWPHLGSIRNIFSAATALAPNDVWAVGTAWLDVGGPTSTPQTLVEHWDGAAWSVVASPNVGLYSALSGVAAVAAHDIWAVGNTGDTPNIRTLALHWDGTVWTVVATPNQGLNNNTLNTVAAVSAAEVWAAGLPRVQQWNGTHWTLTLNPGGPTDNLLQGLAALTAQDIWSVGSTPDSALFLHWDGTTIRSVPGADLGQSLGRPAAVAAAAPDDVWAVGAVFIPEADNQTLTEHWNGRAWTRVASPNVGGAANTDLPAVAVRASDDVWAVGSYYDRRLEEGRTLVLHWNGSTWSQIASPNASGAATWFAGVAAVAADDVWAVGGTGAPGGPQQGLVAHWNGTTWNLVTALPAGAPLTAVSAPAAHDIWAVGGTDQTRVLHWDGTRWTTIPSPNSGTGANHLAAVSARAADDVWAVGDVDRRGGLALHWNGTAWSLVSTTRVGSAALYGVAALAPDSVWAAGAGNTPTGVRQTLVARWSPGTVPYTDIAGNPFYDPITALYCRNVVDGYPDNTFRPYAPASRGTVARWLVTARGWAIDTSGGPHFRDVPATDPLYPYVETAYHYEVISGYADGTFRPGTALTRGQMSKIVVRGWDWALDPSGGPHFRDVDAGNPFYTTIEALDNHGGVSGYACSAGPEPCPGLYFRWGANTTRGQIAKVLANALGP